MDGARPLRVALFALLGITTAACAAFIFAVEVPRFIFGQAIPWKFVVGILSFGTALALLVSLHCWLKLRQWLKSSSAPRGRFRDLLDFVAMSRWHPSVTVALLGLLGLPGAWYFHAGNYWVVSMVRTMGWRALRSGDVQQVFDGLAVLYQLAFAGGLPLLLALHMLSRWRPKNILLTWALVPLVFVGSAVAVVLIVALLH